jgi:hypothetical protein
MGNLDARICLRGMRMMIREPTPVAPENIEMIASMVGFPF